MNKNLLQTHSFFKDKEILEFKLLENQGVCNIIYKVTTKEKTYLLRVFKNTHKTLDERKNEFKIQNMANSYQLTSKAFLIDLKNGFMICDFLKGFHKEKLTFNDLNLLTLKLKKLHKIKYKQKPYSLKKDFKYYKNSLKDEKSQKIIYKSLKELKKLEKYPSSKVLCHHDINYKNVLFSNNDLKFIDWEFACINDLFFDLANICIEFKLTKNQEIFLLKRYFLKLKKENILKLNSYKIIYTNLWILWFKLFNLKSC